MLLGLLKEISLGELGEEGTVLREAVDWQMLPGHANFGPQSSKSDSEESRPHMGGNRDLSKHKTERMQYKPYVSWKYNGT